MITITTVPNQSFDQYAERYDALVENALALTGENKDYFAQGRIRFLAGILRGMSVQPSCVMDYGCGIGSTATHLCKAFDPDKIVGVDVSAQSIEHARRRYGSAQVLYHTIREYIPNRRFDLVYCSSVFHHIVPSQQPDALRYIVDCLRPGGVFAFWEHNPWNPGTRYVMDRCEFDADAIPLSPPAAKRLLAGANLTVVRTDFLFIFPRMLRSLRRIEPHLSRWPIGGQYQILCTKSF